MYYKKRIGVFISHIYGDYQTKLCRGILQKASEYGYLVEIFASNDGEDLGDYGQGEMSILNIPKQGSYDGFILASGTYLLPELKQKIVTFLQTQICCPVIDITQSSSPFPKVILENHKPVRDLVLHLVKVHGFQKICYLGNSSEPDFDGLRRTYFQEGLRESDLPSENCCYTCDGSEESIGQLLAELKEKDELPQAIVCYNDRMALDVIFQLQQLNIQVPEDVAVTGLDTLEFGQRTRPVLTSVTFPIDQIGETAVELLWAAFHGQELPALSEICAAPSIGSSCGCSPQKPDTHAYTRALHRRIAFQEASLLSNMHMSASLQDVEDLDQGMELIADFVRRMPGCREFYLCLYDGWDRISSHIRELTHTCQDKYDAETVLLQLALRDGKRLPECTFTRRSTLPDYLYGSSSYYLYAPLAFGKQYFGYLALSFDQGAVGYDFAFLSWLMNVNSMLKNLCDKKNLGLLVGRLETLYTKDDLTGLLSRQSFRQASAAAFEQAIAGRLSVCVMTFDLDCLRQINAAFGHAEGDFAIQVLAHALEYSADDSCLCAREGGDDFQILIPDCNQQKAQALLERIQSYLDHYNRLHTKGYIIRASWGCSIRIPSAPSELSEMFRDADSSLCEAKLLKDKDIIKG